MWQDLVNDLNDTCVETFGTHHSIELYKGSFKKPIKGIFDVNYLSIDPSTGAQVSSSTPVLGVLANELPDNITTYFVKINGERFKIIDREPDSEGMSKLILSRSRNGQE